MSDDLYVVFSRPPDDVAKETYNAWYDRHLGEILAVPGFVGARRFALRPRRGIEIPSKYPYVAIYEVEADLETLRRNLAANRERIIRPEWCEDVSFISWFGGAIGDGGPIRIPDHCYLHFSAEPSWMSFDEYNTWYQTHLDENVANTDVIVRGWRFRLADARSGVEEEPTHFAVYELDGNIEQMVLDLEMALAAGAISLPDWFRRFVSFDAVALGDRVTA